MKFAIYVEPVTSDLPFVRVCECEDEEDAITAYLCLNDLVNSYLLLRFDLDITPKSFSSMQKVTIWNNTTGWKETYL
jgi:hypothetical protein